MHECCCYKHSCTEVLTEEEHGRGNLHPFYLLGHNGEASSAYGGEEDNDYSYKLDCE